MNSTDDAAISPSVMVEFHLAEGFPPARNVVRKDAARIDVRQKDFAMPVPAVSLCEQNWSYKSFTVKLRTVQLHDRTLEVGRVDKLISRRVT